MAITPREFDALWKVYDASESRAWERTALLAMMYANVHRKEGANPFTLQDFMPGQPEGRVDPSRPTAEQLIAWRKETEGRLAAKKAGKLLSMPDADTQRRAESQIEMVSMFSTAMRRG